MRLMIFALGGAMLAGASASASPEKEAAAAAAAKATAEARGDNAYHCKKFPPKTGSRLGRDRQICMTKQEWEARGEDLTNIIRVHQSLSLQTRDK